MDSKSMGRRIQRRRDELGLKQEQLAEAIGCSTVFMSMIERGMKTPSLDNFVLLTNALNISADWLLADVLDSGYQAEASRLSGMIDGLPPEERKRIFTVVEAMLKRP